MPPALRLIRLLIVSSIIAAGSVLPLDAQLTDAVITTFDGKSVQGNIQSIAIDGRLTGLPTAVALDEIVEVKFPRVVLNERPSQVQVFLTTGSQLNADRVTLKQEQLELFLAGRSTSVLLQDVRAIVWGDVSEEISKWIASPDTASDRVIVSVGGKIDTRDGQLESLSSSELGFNYQGKSRKIGMDKIKGIVMADLGVEKLTGLKAIISTRNRDRWVGVIQSFDGSNVEIRVSPGSTISLPSAQVAGIEVASDRLQFLSDISPTRSVEGSVFVMSRSFQKNRSVAGNPLRLLGDKGEPIVLERGIGVQASSELDFENNGFDRLQALVGIDLETEGRGNCQAVILGDGIRLWESQVVGGKAAIPVDIEIRGIKKLSLVVNAGEEFDLADHLNWGSIRLLKSR